MIPVRELIRPGFVKYHLNDGSQPWPFFPVLHHFTEPDIIEPHDHPWDFQSHVLRGGYVEEVYHIDDGTWRVETVERAAGTVHRVAATHIHRIVELLDDECWTLVVAGPPRRDIRLWRFGERIESRALDQSEWTEEYRPAFEPCLET